MEHDAPFWSTYMGEPTLFGDYLGYHDGEKLLLFGGELDSNAPISDGEANDIFHYSVAALGINYFECWRPGPSPKIYYPDWNVGSYTEDGAPFSIDLVGFSISESTQRSKQVRQATARGYVFEENSSPYLLSGDISLVESFISSKNLGAFDISYNAMLSYFTVSEFGRLFRVRRGGKICALGTISIFGKDRAIFVHTYVDRQERGASDLLYSGIVSYCLDKGYRFLDLGYSNSESLRDYKESWGAKQTRATNSGAYASPHGAKLGPFFHWPMEILNEMFNDT